MAFREAVEIKADVLHQFIQKRYPINERTKDLYFD